MVGGGEKAIATDPTDIKRIVGNIMHNFMPTNSTTL